MSAPVAALARKVFEEYSRAGGNPPDAHFDRNAAEQWMAHALEFAGVAELIEAAGSVSDATVEHYGNAMGLHLALAATGGLNERLSAALAGVKGGAA